MRQEILGIWIVLAMALPSCKARQQLAETKYSTELDIDPESSFLMKLIDGQRRFDICILTNESRRLLHEAFHDTLRRSFLRGAADWLRVAMEHPSGKLPDPDDVQFRIRTEFYRVDPDDSAEPIPPEFRQAVKDFVDDSGSHEEAFDGFVATAQSLTKEHEDGDSDPCTGSDLTIISFTDEEIFWDFHGNGPDGELEFKEYLGNDLYDAFWARTKSHFTELYGPAVAANFVQDMKHNPENWNRARFMPPNQIVLNWHWDLSTFHTNLDRPHDIYDWQLELFDKSYAFRTVYTTMVHELGHALHLGDVYVDSDMPSDLTRHPDAVMGNPRGLGGKIQEDDRQGLFSVIDRLLGSEVYCRENYYRFANLADPRSEGWAYCLPDGFDPAAEINDDDLDWDIGDYIEDYVENEVKSEDNNEESNSRSRSD